MGFAAREMIANEKGGAPVVAVIQWGIARTTLGPMLVGATDRGVCRLSFGEGPDALARRFSEARLVSGGAAFEALLEKVAAAVERPGDSRSIALDLHGTPFQQAVWQELRRIPAGQTRSYAQIAAQIGKPNACRAVGGANRANPVAVLVPCHRVIGADGGIAGYAWGEAIKRELLRRESAA